MNQWISRFNIRTSVLFAAMRGVMAVVVTVAVVLSPLRTASADTNTFSDEQNGSSNEILQQEVSFEHNPESELIIEENEQTQGDIPADTESAEAQEYTDDSTDSDIPSDVAEETETDPISPAPTCEVYEGSSQSEAGTASSSEGETVTEDSSVLEPEAEESTDAPAEMPCAFFVGEGPNTEAVAVDDDSEIDTETGVEFDLDIVNTNDVSVINQVIAEGLSGESDIIAEGDVEDAALEAGDVNVFANVLNVVNTNMYNSEIIEMVENFNDLTTDLYMNALETSPAQRTQDLVAGICDGSLECESLASFRLTNNNRAVVENDVLVAGNSGGNTISGLEVEDSVIRTGNVNALVNVINIVNANLINSRWTIASFNVFGDWEGDLVMPSEMYFKDAMAIGTVIDSDVLVSEVQKVVLSVDNTNEAEIENNVLAEAGTGGNNIAATAVFDPIEGEEEGGDIEESSIESGNGEAYVNVDTHANTILYNGMWFLGMVNTLGDWSGDVYALPEEVAMVNGAFGSSFFATSEQDPAVQAAFEEAIIAAQQSTEVEIVVDNSNEADITNNVLVGAYTGDNTIVATEVERGRIQTGNARALANVLNFANTNLINADLYIGLTNIFGNWNGDIVFGYPDLSVSQTLRQGEFPKQSNSQINYQLDFANTSGTSMRGTQLEWQYDYSLMDLRDVQSLFPYTMENPGTVLFDLGNFAARSTGSAQLQLQTKKQLNDGTDVETLAHIFGTGPERNRDNNQSVFHATTGDNVISIPPIFDSNTGGANGNPQDDQQNQNDNPPITQEQNDTQQDQLKDQQNNAGRLSVTKTNSSGGKSLKVGDELTFTITVENTGSKKVDNVVLYDRLSAPSGELIYDETFEIGTLAAGRSVAVEYDLQITADVPAGVYTNSAYAQGFGSGLQTIKSSLARSSFKVMTTAPELTEPPQPPLQPLVPNEDQPQPAAEPADDLSASSQLDDRFNSVRDNFTLGGTAKAAGNGGSRDSNAGSVLGQLSPKNRSISLIPEANATGVGSLSLGSPWMSSILISLLVAIGYATASVREKIKLKKQKP